MKARQKTGIHLHGKRGFQAAAATAAAAAMMAASIGPAAAATTPVSQTQQGGIVLSELFGEFQYPTAPLFGRR